MASMSARAAEPIAETTLGRLRGVDLGGCWAFRGVRYAVAERFAAPRLPSPHAGVQGAFGVGPSAPQSNPRPPTGPSAIILPHLPRPPGAAPPSPLPESEDCLVLNVWTSGLGDGRKRPVMVWLHGGFFSSGSGSTVDGASLARRGDVVVVSLNHRLNAFGFTHLGHPDFPQAANVGMLDIVAALQWVRDNIEAFGGDPKRVMVFGVSGGGMKTTFLTASPRARGLLHRAAVQSGPALRFMTADRALEATDRLYRAMGLKAGDVAGLRTASVEALLGGYHAVAAQLPPRRFTHLSCFAPVLDGDVLPRQPLDADATRQAAEIPLLIGSNAQEMSFFMGADAAGFDLDEAGLRARVETLLGPRAGGALESYARAYPHTTPSRRWIQLFSDYAIELPTTVQAERHARAGGRTWLYRLDFESPALGGKLGALHTLEGPLVFDTVEASRNLLGAGPKPEILAKAMSSAWVAFATTGNPNTGVGPHWPEYRLPERPTFIFDGEPRLVRDVAGQARAALGAIAGL